MGACKRLAELYLHGRNARSASTRAIAVRFGNVLGSQGSVIEVFERQIATGGPVTLTHRDMRRYFMTIDEAVALILLAVSRDAKRGDAASYLLEMGAPVKILHLAQRMIKASGRDIAIVETGARKGEKIDEELHADQETLHKTGVKGLLSIQSNARRTVTDADIDRLETLACRGDEAGARAAVFELVHECLVDPPKPNAVADTVMAGLTRLRAPRGAPRSDRPS